VLRTLFGLHGRVNRRAYLVTGISLMLLKYALDATAIYLIAHVVWTPLDYLVPLFTYRAAKLAAIPPQLALVFALWTLPFIWIGVTMMMKRAIDAGKSPAWCAFFLIPILNYAVMLWLGAFPSIPNSVAPAVDAHAASGARYRSALLGIAGAAAVALVAVLFSVFAFGSYGLTLFLATPFIQGMVVGYSYNRDRQTTGAETVSVVALSVLLVGGVMLLFALEGVVCLLMALPLALGLGALGGLVGRVMARARSGGGLGFAPALFALPSGAMMDKVSPPAPTYEVVSTVDVAAAPQTVWTHVVQFGEITEAPAWYFRAGIAYPLRASIRGTGVGAVRRCEFSTGAFVEPITAWEPPSRLAFDVIAQPPPLRELSIYAKVYAPHLDGYFRSSRGEFRMIALANGETRLEGHTWYSVAIYPQAYWRGASEMLLHRIHRRVLEQVKRESELATVGKIPQTAGTR
jgi:uncharacterized membrane protein YhaH (DUF805 family)